jgi:hypothetical protein
MRPVKSKPKFRCDFCNHTSTKVAMERHERICWKNPNRYCDLCNNTGEMDVDDGMGYRYSEPCYWCKQFDPDRVDPFRQERA